MGTRDLNGPNAELKARFAITLSKVLMKFWWINLIGNGYLVDREEVGG
jgi:hypothetical protein